MRALLGVLWCCSSAVYVVDGVDVVDVVAVVDEDVGGYILYMRHPCLCVCGKDMFTIDDSNFTVPW